MRASAEPDRPTGEIPLAAPALGVALGTAGGLLGSGGPIATFLGVPLLWWAARLPGRPLALALLLGLVLGRGAAVGERVPPSIANMADGSVHHVEAVVQRAELPAHGMLRILARVQRIGDPPRPLPGGYVLPVVVHLRGPRAWRNAELTTGARISALTRIRHRWRGIEGFVHHPKALEILAPGRGPGTHLDHARREADRKLRRHLSRRDAGLARALLLGDRGKLDPRDRTLFRQTGQAHLLAVSGLHVGLLLAGLLLVLRRAGASLRVTWWMGLLCAAFYVPFAGAPPSAIRAGLGAAVWFVARLAGRQPRGLGLLTLVGVCILLTRPVGLRSASFQLSFAAVFGILWLAPRLRRGLVRPRPIVHGILPPRRAPLRTALSVSTAAWLATTPLVAFHIGRLCPAGPLLSVIAVPLTAGLLAAGSGLLLGEGVPGLGPVAAHGFALCASALRTILETAEAAGLGAVAVRAPTPLWCGLYVGGFLAAARGRGRIGLAGLLLIGGLILTLWVGPQTELLFQEHAPRSTVPGAYDAATVRIEPLAAIHPLQGFLPLLACGIGLLLFSVVSVRLRWLGPRGAAAAWLLGVISTWQFGWAGLGALLAPFLVATLLGKMPHGPRARARSLRQVLCNGAPALLGCLFSASGRPDVGLPWFLGALACLGADTCATEIGVRFGGAPFRLLGRGPIQSGESGGVTLLGLAASVGGAALAPAAFVLSSEPAWAVLGAMTTAGVLGALVDSLLGGTLQFRGRHPRTGAVTEKAYLRGGPVKHVAGWRWLDNDAVNLLTGLAAGLAGVGLIALV